MRFSTNGTLAESQATGIPEHIIVTTLEVVNASVIYICVCIGLCAWDAIVSLKTEYNVIWKAQWSFVKMIYIMSRYWIFVGLGISIWLWTGQFTPEQCRHYFPMIPGLLLGTELAGETILLMRVYALSGKRLWVLLFLASIQIAYSAVCLFIAIDGMQMVPIFNDADYCIPTGGPHGNIILAYWIIPMAFDSIVTGLMLWFTWPYLKIGTASGILKVIIGQGLLYFLIITIANTLNVAFYVQTNFPNQSINAGFSLAMTSVMSCRLVLNLRNPGATTVKGVGGQSFWLGRSAVMNGPEATATAYSTSKSSLKKFTPTPLPLGHFSNHSVHAGTVILETPNNELDEKLLYTELNSKSSGARGNGAIRVDVETHTVRMV